MTEVSCAPQVTEGNLGIAFGLVAAAGLSTSLGAALAFVIPFSSDGKNLILASSLAIAAGVMTYVSFVEILTAKSIPAFEACVGDQYAYLYATLCFFGGLALTRLFDEGLHLLQRRVARGGKRQSRPTLIVDAVQSAVESAVIDAHPDPDIERTSPDAPVSDSSVTHSTPSLSRDGDERLVIDHAVGHDGHMVAEVYREGEYDKKRLARMGMFAGLAIAAHNLPEGLATFVAVLDDPKVGASVAVAIAIHNIPEGICVAMPIFYATGSRKKAFFWATLSGVAELLGALLGWLVLRKVFSQVVYGITFGVIAGMMVYIALKDLLPTAHRYDPDDQVTTLSLISGMLIMSVSLVLFLF